MAKMKLSPSRSHAKQKKRPLGWLWWSLLWAAVPLAMILLFQLAKGNRAVMTFLVECVTTPLKRGISWLCDRCPFAVAEVLWTGAALGVVFFLGRTVWLLLRRPQRLRRLVRRGLAAVSAVLFLYCGYTLMWGCNYYVASFCEQSGLEERAVSAEELYTLMAAFASEAAALSGQVERGEDGLCTLDVDEVFDRAVTVYDGLLEEFPTLAGPERRPKPIVFSRLISYLDFTGFFFPFTGEATINVDQPEFLIPSTILHEISHQRNVASEEECNFLAILAGVKSEDVEFRYSSCMLAYIHLSNALRRADRELWEQAYAHLGEAARADSAANNAYWAQFDTPVKSVSTATYSGFIKSYGQKEGLALYGKCVDLLVAYYFDACPEAQFW